MRYGLITIFLLLFSAGTQLARAQQQLLTTYTMNDGLVHNNIRRIYQDSRGFIWIGTWEGLSKYDGHKFTNYTTGNGLSHELVNDIYESKDGKIYITCNDGTINIVKDHEAPRDITQKKIIINRLVRLSTEKVIAATDLNGIQEFKDGKLFKPPQSYPGKNYLDITEFNDSLLIASSENSIELLTHRYEIFADWKETIGYFEESKLLADSKKRIWLCTREGLKLLSPYQEKGQPFRFLELPPAFNLPLLKNEWVRNIFEDVEGNIWLGTFYNGLIKVRPDGSHEIITDKSGLPAPDITCIYQDRERNIWIGTSLGMAKLVTKNSIRIYTVEDGLLSNSVYITFPVSDNKVIVESVKGLQSFDRLKNQFTDVSAQESIYQDNNPNSAVSLLVDNKDKLRYITYYQNKSTRLSFGPNSIGTYYCVKDNYGHFFYPSSGLLTSQDLHVWEKVLYDFDIRALMIDSKNYLWIGTHDHGIYRIRYDFVDNKIRLLGEERFLPGKGIRALFEDSKGNIWVGSRYNGLYQINPEQKDDPVVQHFDLSNGLTSNRVVAIGEDNKGCIWTSFYQGLDKLIPVKNSYRVFNFSRFNNFFGNIQSIMFDRDYTLWIGTTKGMVQISDGALENSLPLRTYITSATLGDSIYRNRDDKKISVSYRHRQVQFEFAAPGFINEKQNFYSYRLLGSNNTDWSQPANEHGVSYASLQPGNFRFEVRTLGWNGQWGETDSYDFSIRSPFWQTWWFRGSAVLLLIVISWLLFKKRIRAIRHEADIRHRIAETEMKALRAQMNPHFIFNCLNAIDNLVQTHQADKATTYLAKFAKLLRAVLESSKKNLIPFQTDWENLDIYLQMEKFRTNNKFHYEMKADPELHAGDYKVPPLIVQPFLENAIQHGLLNKESGERNLKVDIKLGDDHILYTITDNGIGREEAQRIKNLNRPEHISHGMQITRDRINLHNQNGIDKDIHITDLKENGLDAGTQIEVKVKIKDNQ